ncbi:unnamed protein product [Cuscuta europaea]|uniref:Uncharacterized protein n=1 Tax=Cuscuta europaea TaxID=41803 RepID=A0A9P1ENU4_CUSEU|nr:unnamed protein product [Cuscuta europaea]
MKMSKHDAREEEDEEEETLSLCDLPIYSSSSSSDWEKFSSQSSVSSSSTLPSDHFFEFFSEEWSSNKSNLPPEQIVFFGKLIIPQVGIVPEKDNGKRVKSKQRNGSSSSSKNDGDSSKVVGMRESAESLSPPRFWRSRWFLFFFGMGGLPKEMELRELRIRQSRREMPSPSSSHGGREKGLWWVIKALSCGRGGSTQVHAHAIVRQRRPIACLSY